MNALSRSIVVKIVVFLTVLLWLSCGQKPESITSQFRIISDIKENPQSPFYINFAEYPREREALPIGVFDSGTGGLTV